MPGRQVIGVAVVVGVLVWAVAVPHAGAASVILRDLNSEAHFDPGSQEGMHNWYVDGNDHMFQQWFWYRVGATGGESSIDQLATPVWSASNGNQDPDDDVLDIEYHGSQLEVDFRFILRGGMPGSHEADITEQIDITNVGSDTLDVHFFQYCDFDLDDVAAGDRGAIVGGNRALQGGGIYSASESVVTSFPDHHQVAFYDDILTSLNDGDPTTLTDFCGPLVNGNVTWAFEWDITLAPNDTFQISKVKSISPDIFVIPEPGAISLILLGGSVLALRRRRLRPVR